jgi:hypothetical protein
VRGQEKAPRGIASKHNMKIGANKTWDEGGCSK